MPSNYRVLLLAGIAFAAGIAFMLAQNAWLSLLMGLISVAFLVLAIVLSAARQQRPSETPEQAEQRREQTADRFDPDP